MVSWIKHGVAEHSSEMILYTVMIKGTQQRTAEEPILQSWADTWTRRR